MNKTVCAFAAVFLLFAGCSGREEAARIDDAPGGSHADVPDDKAVLLSGPEKKRGIDVFPPNVIDYFHGVYSFHGENVRVQFTREEIVPLTGWEQERCGDYPLFLLPEAADGRVFFYQGPETTWSVFIKIPAHIEDHCVFISRFLDRLIYFIGVSRGDEPAPFPAVLQLQ